MDAIALLQLAQVLAASVGSGVTTVQRIVSFLRAEGVTDAQLADLDTRLTEVITRREAERTANP